MYAIQRVSRPSSWISMPSPSKIFNSKYSLFATSPLHSKKVSLWPYRTSQTLNRAFYLVRSGYPPRTLTLVPELPLSSLGLQAGEQIIVNHKVPTATTTNPSAPTPASRPSAPARQTAAPQSTGPVSVPTSSGVLVHRVRRPPPYPSRAANPRSTRSFPTTTPACSRR